MSPHLPQSLSGRVVHGDAYGTRLGFPTANLQVEDPETILPFLRPGIYFGYTYLIDTPERTYTSAIVVESKTSQLPKVEVHLLDFTGNLYEKRLHVSFEKFIRPFSTFATETDLIRQITDDIRIIKHIASLKST